MSFRPSRPTFLAAPRPWSLRRASPGPGASRATWKQHAINSKSMFETVGVFDVDNDGKLDVVSGDTWYQGPGWTPHHVREVSRTGTYLNDFATLPIDVNGDGHTDFVTCAYFTRNVGWVENPGKVGKDWTYHEIDKPGTSEAAVLVDLTGDGKPGSAAEHGQSGRLVRAGEEGRPSRPGRSTTSARRRPATASAPATSTATGGSTC